MADRRPLGPAAKARLAGEVVWTYAAARRALFRADLPSALERLRRRGPDAGTGATSYEDGLRLGRAVARTLAVLPADSRCLMQSLVLTGLLARRGTPATLVIGVKPGHDFGAHAWVELDGRPLLPPMADEFTRLVDL